MPDFIRDENIKLYRTALGASIDDEQRRVLQLLLRILVDEQAAVECPKAITLR